MRIYSSESHVLQGSVDIQRVAQSSGDSQKEILYLTSSKDDLRVGLCLGRRLIKEKLEVTDIIVFKRETLLSEFVLEREREFTRAARDKEKVCITFTFNATNRAELLFATQNQIFAWNYMDENKRDRVIQRYLTPLDSPNLRYVKFNKA